MVCDVGETDQYYVQWDELSERDKRGWGSEYAYNEWGTKVRKVEMGHISGKGEFYSDITDVPLWHNTMMVIRVGAKAAREIRAKSKGPAA
jgi:hypothetical protein